jgi:1-acyl-sn-glycerol-3-phosphate acyltransferase
VRFVRAPLGWPVRGALRLCVYLIFTLSMIPIQVVLVKLGHSAAATFPIWYHRRVLWMIGIRLDVKGNRSEHRPTLFVVNHCSYLDIEILGALVSASFIAKSEVASWPLFGWLAKLQRTVFVDRKRQTTHRQRDDIAQRLAHGDSLILFPEGTSGPGNGILPFRSALLSVAETGGQDPALWIQPVSLSYVEIDGIPMGRSLRPLLAWYGDMQMANHLWRVACLGRIGVCVEFHAPVQMSSFASRKQLTHYCAQQVAEGMARAFGHSTTPAKPDRMALPSA